MVKMNPIILFQQLSNSSYFVLLYTSPTISPLIYYSEENDRHYLSYTFQYAPFQNINEVNKIITFKILKIIL